MGKKIAILQSCYIPWKGYFDLVNSVDEFILYDDAQYTKNDWRNRNRIKTRSGVQWITIPVFKNALSQKICETRTTNDLWRKKHWKTLLNNYSKAKFFGEYREIFEELYLGSTIRSLSRINYQFLSVICNILGIDTKISWSMDYRLIGGKTERLIELCRQASATEYISGPAAKDYMDEGLFFCQDITLRYVDYSGYDEYHQLFPPFEHHVSVIDLIFNEGPNATKFLKSFDPNRKFVVP